MMIRWASKVQRRCDHPGQDCEAVGGVPHVERGHERDVELRGYRDKDAAVPCLARRGGWCEGRGGGKGAPYLPFRLWDEQHRAAEQREAPLSIR